MGSLATFPGNVQNWTFNDVVRAVGTYGCQTQKKQSQKQVYGYQRGKVWERNKLGSWIKNRHSTI